MRSVLRSALQKRTPTRMSPQEGKIIAVDPGGRDETGKLIRLDVKAGDRVLFGKWSGTDVKTRNEELLIMKEATSLASSTNSTALRTLFLSS
jgi:co-chaperonin GroES (HSP10)